MSRIESVDISAIADLIIEDIADALRDGSMTVRDLAKTDFVEKYLQWHKSFDRLDIVQMVDQKIFGKYGTYRLSSKDNRKKGDVTYSTKKRLRHSTSCPCQDCSQDELCAQVVIDTFLFTMHIVDYYSILPGNIDAEAVCSILTQRNGKLPKHVCAETEQNFELSYTLPVEKKKKKKTIEQQQKNISTFLIDELNKLRPCM